MKKTYCDYCEDEITSDNGGLYLEAHGSIGFVVSLSLSVDGKNESDIDICKYCVIEAVNRLDDRPRESKAS